MGIIPSSDLYDLVKSLTLPEKGYIIRHAFQVVEQENGSSVIKKMFDFIDKSSFYNEKEMIAAVFNKNAKMAAVYKRLLHDKILKNLSNYHLEKSIKARLYKKLHMAEMLYNKALYSQCRSLLNKIETEAKKYELFTILIEVSELRSAFMAWGAKSEQDRTALVEQLFQEDTIYIKNLALNLNYWKTSIDYFFYLEKNHFVNDDNSQINEDMIWNNPLLNSEKFLHTHRTKIQYNNTLANYYMRKRNPQLLYTHYKNNYTYVRQNTLQQLYPGSYITALTGLIQACIMLNKFNEGLKYVEELSVFDTHGIVALEKRKFFFATIKKMELLTKSAKVKDAIIEFKSGFEKFIVDENDLNVYLKSSAYFIVSLMYFSVDDYKKAEEWLIKIFDLPDIKKQAEIFLYSKLFYLVILFERKKDDLIPSVLRSIYKLNPQNRSVEKNLFAFFKQLQEIKTDEEFTLLLKQLQNEIIKIVNNPLENQFMEYFDILSWLESKIQNRPMIEILKEKSLKVGKV